MPTKRAARRVPRNTLSRAAIVDAALRLIDATDSKPSRCRSSPQQLGVGTMSLYRHVEDKDDLIDAVAERVMRDIQVPAGDADDWEGRGRRLPPRTRATPAIAHPALSAASSPNAVSRSDPSSINSRNSHGILVAAGFDETDAVRTFYSLLTYVFGFVIWELPRVHQQPGRGATPPRGTTPSTPSTPTDYPHLHALRQTLTTSAHRTVRARWYSTRTSSWLTPGNPTPDKPPLQVPQARQNRLYEYVRV